MTRADQIVESINKMVVPSGNSFSAGIVRVAQKGQEKINYDLNNKPIVFDDKYENYAYHKLLKQNYTVLQERGVKKTYLITANMNMFVFSTERQSHDDMIALFSGIKNVTINSTDFDSYKILKQETSVAEYDIKKYIFAINYDIKYTSNECLTSCDE